jgi:hypothetical protein
MKWQNQLLCGVLCSFLYSVAHAQSCYEQAHIPPEYQVVTSHSTLILLDETVAFSDEQHAHIRHQLTSIIGFGIDLRVIAFSAFIDDQYIRPVLRVKIASPLEETARYTMRKDRLREFDDCQEKAIARANSKVVSVLQDYKKRASDKIAKSEIIATLRDVGEKILPSMSGRARRLILVSDMLENSDVTTFYTKGGIRQLDVTRELAVVGNRQLFSDLHGASVYVIGAGVAPPGTDNRQYKSSGIMDTLKVFWAGYFDRSNGRLIEFGNPLLMNILGDQR